MKLRVIEGKNAGQEIPIKGKKFLIGRAEDCQLRPGSELISRHHCAILIEEGYLAVRDFGSKNGTYVNDERVVGERELKAGDRLTIGHLQFEVHVAHRVGAKKQPPVGDVKEAVARTASNAAKDPLDVTQWLAADAATDTTASAAMETQDASFTDTDSINLSAMQTVTPESSTEEEATRGRKGKKTPGKLPPIPNTTKDSQGAAAAVLSRMRKRR
ncbi:MAG: FHA domain-containing protein [Pirellulales bacterium]